MSLRPNLPRRGAPPLLGKTCGEHLMRLSSILRAWSARLVGALRRGRGGAENGRERPLTAREVALARVEARRLREEVAERSLQELRENPPYLVRADGARYTPGMTAANRKTNRKDT